MTSKLQPLKPASVPHRMVKSKIAWNYSGMVDVYDEIPDYNGWNCPEGFTNIRSLTGSAFSLKRGFRVLEIHKTMRSEADFQLIFGRRRFAKIEDFACDVRGTEKIIEDAVKELGWLLSLSYPKEISFRFDDATVLNGGSSRRMEK